jgi:peptidoglycan L-alanyl-D-glutamate endopeptidase CwlK
MAASYGRELEAQRRPDRHWWLRRLLIVPLLAIFATTATELFGLSRSGAAFAAAMLALGGYDAIKLVEAKWRRRVDHALAEPSEGGGGRMSYRLGARSKARLAQVHPDLRRVMMRAIALSPLDFTILEGRRTIERQRALLAAGATRTLDSRHLPTRRTDWHGPWTSRR